MVWAILLYTLGVLAGAFTLFCVVMAMLEKDILPGLLLLFIGGVITCALLLGGWECQNATNIAMFML